jgi:hypothetical protein
MPGTIKILAATKNYTVYYLFSFKDYFYLKIKDINKLVLDTGNI